MTILELLIHYLTLFTFLTSFMSILRVKHHLKLFEVVLFLSGVALAIFAITNALTKNIPIQRPSLVALFFLSYCYLYLGSNLKSQFFNPTDQMKQTFAKRMKTALRFDKEADQHKLPDSFLGVDEVNKMQIGKKLHISKKLLFERKVTVTGHILFMVVMTAGGKTRFYWHDRDELHICDVGKLVIHIKEDNGKVTKKILEANETFRVKSGVKHSLTTGELTIIRTYFEV